MIVRAEYERRRATPSDISDHLPRLHAEASIGEAQIIELGVRGGNSTAAFLAALETHGGYLWSVDIAHCPMPWGWHPQWTFHQGDDLWLAHDLPDRVDIVFIDTSHHYQQTVAELELYVPKVKPGGVVLLHDTELQHPEQSPPDDPPFPVRVAIDEYCDEYGLIPEYVPGCYGLGAIRIPGGAD